MTDNYVNQGSWHYRVEQLIKQALSSLGGGASESTQTEILQSLVAQTQQLSGLLTAQSALLTTQNQVLQNLLASNEALLASNEDLKSTYSETWVSSKLTEGARIIKPDPVPTEYQTFQLISLDILYESDGTGGDRYLTLERVVPNIPAYQELQLLHGDRLLGGAWQNGTLNNNTVREQTWCQDAVIDNYSRMPIPLLSLNNQAQQSWRLRSIDVPGAGDTCFSVWTFRVFRA